MGKIHIIKGKYLGLNLVEVISLLLNISCTSEKQSPDTSELGLI